MSNKTTKQTRPVKPKNKTLTIKDIQRQQKQAEKMSTYILDQDYEANTNTIIKYYEKFGQSRIDALLEEVFENLQNADKDDLRFFKGESEEAQFLFYISFLTAVRFTSLSKDVPRNFSEQVPIMLEMYDTGLLYRIHDEVLDQGEVAKITDKIQDMMVLVNKLVNLEEDERKKVLDTIQNKDILMKSDPIHPLVSPTEAEPDA